jgi:hypothetical protein
VKVSWGSVNLPVKLVRPGQRMEDGQCISGWGLAIGGEAGDLLIIEGTPEDLLGLSQRIVSAVAEFDARSSRHIRTGDRPWRLTGKGILATSKHEPPPAA